jgi:hypothetical protein
MGFEFCQSLIHFTMISLLLPCLKVSVANHPFALLGSLPLLSTSQEMEHWSIETVWQTLWTSMMDDVETLPRSDMTYKIALATLQGLVMHTHLVDMAEVVNIELGYLRALEYFQDTGLDWTAGEPSQFSCLGKSH